MKAREIISLISKGHTAYILDLLKLPDWRQQLDTGPVRPMQWLVYYNDLTGLRAVLEAGGSLNSIELNAELGNAAFFGHWKICDFLIRQGANVNAAVDETGETALHNALAKAGRPYYRYTVRVLVENGARINAQTLPGIETGAFMRDVRTCGETPLHRAAAFADAWTIRYLIEHGADIRQPDANGDTPLSWASRHLRPGEILALLAYGKHKISQAHIDRNTSDHGAGWGNSMDWNLLGEYVIPPKS